ncbi:PIG-L family deacetylase [Nonomuraea sp. WAC 01424]|nr:PIG-L family deacetylase [Nonomuraea sp. WAC 01424]
MLQNPDQARLLAISPHLDDAVLSVGAGLAQAAQDGAEVTVFTVFAGIAEPPFSSVAAEFHASWGLSPDQNAPQYRRSEDIAALDHLGVNHRHGRFLDAIYRRSPDGRWLVDRGERPVVHPQPPDSNNELVSAAKDDIKSLIEEYDPTLLVTCVAVGNHVDHEITRDAALLAAEETGVPIRLWQDLPYAADMSSMPDLPNGLQLGPPVLGFVEEEARERKFQAVKHYASQLPMLNGGRRDLFTKLDELARKMSPDGRYSETTWPVIRPE